MTACCTTTQSEKLPPLPEEISWIVLPLPTYSIMYGFSDVDAAGAVGVGVGVEGSVVTGPNIKQRQHRGRLCHTTDHNLETARYSASIKNNSWKKILASVLVEEFSCIVRAGYWRLYRPPAHHHPKR